MKNQKRLKVWFPVLIIMIVIFLFSNQPAVQSSKVSSSIMIKVVEVIEKTPVVKSIKKDTLHTFIRKLAHFSIYAVLGVFVFRALIKGHNVSRFGKRIALLICVIYASTDEIHQLFVAGRSGELKDVFIDSLGALAGIGLYLTYIHIRRKMKTSIS